ncbi:hypothetical protein A2U01_0084434, partial [Trifolium medium]|nr:hypothetical protein [Trifolium medium]
MIAPWANFAGFDPFGDTYKRELEALERGSKNLKRRLCLSSIPEDPSSHST